ncbi:hypothetical protein B0H14DRAFT_3431856 [Mycena olivaceomarginata]|nr:hypothetical protein B0H14DRAFT_3431856 [Mycena olivaceomarginata]
MLPDLQLIYHPPSNGGVVWRIDVSVLYAWGWKFGSTAPDSAARITGCPRVPLAYPTGLPFGPHPVPGPAPFPIATPTSPPTIPLPLLAVPPPLDRCNATPAHRPPHPLVTPSHPFAAPAAPCALPAPPARYSAIPARCTRSLHPLPRSLLRRSLLVASAHRTCCLGTPTRYSAAVALSPPLPVAIALALPPLVTPPHLPNPLAALPHHRTTAPNAVLPPLPAASASACLSPCFPNNLLDRVYPTPVTSNFVSPIVLSGSSSLRNHPNSWSAASLFPTTTIIRFPSPAPVLSSSELLTGGGSSASDAARLLGGKWSGGST